MKQDLSPAKVSVLESDFTKAYPEVVQRKIPIFELMNEFGDHFTRFNVLLESNIKRSGKTASEYLNVFSTSGFNTPLHEAMPYSPWMLETLIKHGASCDLEGAAYWHGPMNTLAGKVIPLNERIKPRSLLQEWADRCTYNDQVDRTAKLRILLESGCDPNRNENEGEKFSSLFFKINNIDQLMLIFQHGIDVSKHLSEEDQGNCVFRHEQIDKYYRAYLVSQIAKENVSPSIRRQPKW